MSLELPRILNDHCIKRNKNPYKADFNNNNHG